MNILIINAGSSSVKFGLYRPNGMRSAASGYVERIGLGDTILHYRTDSSHAISKYIQVGSIQESIRAIIELLAAPETGVIRSAAEISAVGHRVVHGGEKMKAATLVTDDVRNAIRSCFELAPLHNPPNLQGIEACSEIFPNLPQVAVFDTAFHGTLPEHAYLYALPYKLYESEKIRRYGFHGTSHMSVSKKAAGAMGKPLENLSMVTCHLGNGCSISAVSGGKSIDTSMGFTPLEGVPMGTRSGDIDPAVGLFLVRQRGYTVEDVDTLLNRESGFLGLSEIGSSDMRDIESAMKKGDPGALRTLRVFTYKVKKYLGAYAFAMGKLDAIVFTGGIGENSSLVRSLICQDLESFGVEIDPSRNCRDVLYENAVKDISCSGKSVRILVVPTDEEMEIAQQVYDVLSGNQC